MLFKKIPADHTLKFKFDFFLFQALQLQRESILIKESCRTAKEAFQIRLFTENRGRICLFLKLPG